MRMRSSWLTGILAMAVALTVLAGPALAQKQTVVIYTAIENEQITEYKKAYEKSLPNLDVKMLRLSTGDIAARFMAEKDNMQADLIWGVGATNLLVFKNSGLLEPYAPKGLEKIQPLFRDKANPPSWVGIDIYMSAFCFNTEVAKKNNLPKPESWADLTKPVYKGQVVMPNPATLGHGVSVGRLHPPAHGRGRRVEVSRCAQRQHRGVHQVRLQALQGRSGGRARHRRILRVRGARDEEEGEPGGDGAAQGRLRLRDGGQCADQEGAKNPAAKQFLDWAASDEAMKLYSQYFAAVGVAGFPVPEGLPKDISKVVYPNDFDWSAKNRDRILAEWTKRYAK